MEGSYFSKQVRRFITIFVIWTTAGVVLDFSPG